MPLDAEYVRAVSSAAENHTRTILETGTTEGIAVRGQQVVLVTVRGAKTGTLRKVPVMRVEHDGVYAMVASLGGAPKNPAWYHSIKAEPDVELQDGTRTRAFAAREVTGDEKAVWWAGGRRVSRVRRVPAQDRARDPRVRAGAHTGRSPAPGALTPDMPLEGEYEISPTGWVREQTEKIFETGTTESVGIKGMAVVLLTTRGAKTGKLRKVPLMRVEHDGSYAIVASLGGAPKNPVWYYNVKAEPQVELQDGTGTSDFRAREVTGEEKAVWWERAVAAYPDYADYQKKTTRQIPVFVLEPVAA